jgi:peroxiredoxin
VHGINLFAQKPRKPRRVIRSVIDRLRVVVKRYRMPKAEVEIGRQAPDFVVPVQPGPGEFRLSAERGHFVLLFFVPGAWCPVCHVNLRIYRQRASELAERNVKLAVVSMSSGPEAEAFAREIGLDYVVLRDEEWRIARQFGAVSSSPATAEDIALPASFLIDPEGIVRHASRPYDVTDLADGKAFIEVLEAV